MKQFLLCILLSCWALVGHAQALPPEAALASFYDHLNAYPCARYSPDLGPGLERLVLRSNFSNDELAALRLGERQLVRVDLVYTAFRLDPSFSQRQLNLGRLRNLALRVPGLLDDKRIDWHLVEQTGCATPAECHDFFHGFVLYFEKVYTAADTRREVDTLLTKLGARVKKFDKIRAVRARAGRPIPCGYPLSNYKLTKLAKRVRRRYACPTARPQVANFRAEVGASGEIERVAILDSTIACPDELAQALRESFSFANGFLVGKRVFPFSVTGRVVLPARRNSLRISNYLLADSLIKKYRISLGRLGCTARQLRPGEPLDADTLPLPNPDADVVSKVMARHPDWTKRVVVADVTASMVPYTLDLLTWLQLITTEEDKTFVFFNDGDDLPDGKKVIGSTGGLHDVTTADFGRIKATVVEAMKAGGGGDAPENDGEAIRRALELAPDAREVILVADNHTFPRDTALLADLPAQVRIILCGTSGFVNTQYLGLARRYGFTLHTLEGDLTELSQAREGETIVIQGAQYVVTKDGFQLIKRL